MIKQLTLFCLVLLLSSFYMYAQAPNQINYQGIAHQLNGNAIANQNISIRLSIHHATANGVVQYSESRNVTTAADGLFNIQIGSAGASNTTGSWSAITWDNGAKFLQVEMDAAGGANFVNMGTQQLVSVPYAQYANKAGSLIPSATINPSQLTNVGAGMNDVLKFNGTNWVPGTIPSGTLSLPYNVADSNVTSFAITNTSAIGGSAIFGKASTSNVNASGIRGESVGTNGNGVYGKAAGTSSLGVLGQNTTGVGVKGISNSSRGVEGISTSGTALYGSSGTGYALETNGYVKLGGSNMNPSDGAVLTSDASGNATWKNVKVGFQAGESVPASSNIIAGTLTKLKFHTQLYDVSNNFNVEAASTDKSTFIAPVSGLYHFDARCQLHVPSSSNQQLVEAYIFFNLNGNSVRYDGIINPAAQTNEIYLNTRLNEDIHLNAGDKLDVRIYQTTYTGITCNYYDTYFSGHLVFAD